MKILIAHSAYKNNQPSGENRVVLAEISELQKYDVEVVLNVREASQLKMSYFLSILTNVKIVKVKLPGFQKYYFMKKLRKIGIDLIHIHNTFPLIDFTLLDAAQDLDIPIVFSLHNYRFSCINGLFYRNGALCELCIKNDKYGNHFKCYKSSRILSTLATNHKRRYLDYLLKAERILVLNEITRKYLLNLGVQEHRIELKRNFIRDARSTPNTQKNESKEILWVGRIDEAKGLGGLLACWMKSELPHLGYRLIVAGDGPLKATLQNKYRDSNSIEFLGSVSSHQMNAWYHKTKFLLVSSTSLEGFPLVVSEAAMNGVMVIAPKHGAFMDLIAEEWVTLVANSEESWVTSLNRIPSLANKSESARNWYQDNATPEIVTKKLVQTYVDSLLERGLEI